MAKKFTLPSASNAPASNSSHKKAVGLHASLTKTTIESNNVVTKDKMTPSKPKNITATSKSINNKNTPKIQNTANEQINVTTKAPTNAELKKVIDRLNHSLRALEKAGLAADSKFYSEAFKAYKRGVPYLHLTEDGKIRYGSGYLKRKDVAGREKLLKQLLNIESIYAKSKTVTGVKATQAKKRTTLEQKVPGLKERFKRDPSLLKHINEIFQILREHEFVDSHNSGDFMDKIGEISQKTTQEILNIADKLSAEKESSVRGRLADSYILDSFIK